MATEKCVDCGGEAEHVYEVIVKPSRSRKGKSRRWKGGICEECLQKRFEGIFTVRPM